METGMTAAGTGGIFKNISLATGLPPIAVEMCFIVLGLIFLLVTITVVFAIFRIRREMISLNFKIIYIGRLIEQAVKGPQMPEAAKRSAKAQPRKPSTAESTEVSEKFKL